MRLAPGATAARHPLPTCDYLAMFPPASPMRAVILRRISLVLAVALSSAGCHCHMPTIHTEVNAEGHMLNEAPTPGNSGPVHPFNVPAANGDSCGPIVAVIDIDGLLARHGHDRAGVGWRESGITISRTIGRGGRRSMRQGSRRPHQQLRRRSRCQRHDAPRPGAVQKPHALARGRFAAGNSDRSGAYYIATAADQSSRCRRPSPAASA